MALTVSPFDRRVNVLRALIDEVNRLAELVDAEGGGVVAKLSATATVEDDETLVLRDSNEEDRLTFDGTRLHMLSPSDVAASMAEVSVFPHADGGGAGFVANTGTDVAHFSQASIEVRDQEFATHSELKLWRWHQADGDGNVVQLTVNEAGSRIAVETENGAGPGIVLAATPTAADLTVIGGGVVLKSPDETSYRIVVADGGVLSTETVV